MGTPDERLALLTLEDKVALLTGQDFWRTRPLLAIGLPSLLMSDGPVGVRGEAWDERRPSLNLPSATVLAATWDPALAREYGRVLAGEARRRSVDVLLAPTVNLHRSPLAGRHFECFSEDPLLTSDLATEVVRGLQECGVGATVKHYVANDYETERFTASSDVSERALHEVYLRAFEGPVVDGGAWLVMSAYNAVNGTLASESPLLTDPLKTTWGFDGVVVSDWAATRSLDAARAAQDLVMPGPHGPWGDALVAAVRAGEVAEDTVDDKVRRILRLADRVAAPPAVEAPDETAGVALAREVAADGCVLLANDGLLPLEAARLSRIAVLGHNAAAARTQGGGSATVLPVDVASPLDGLRSALPGVRVDHAMGAVVQEGIAGLPLAEMTLPGTDEPGALVRFLDDSGTEIHREHRLATDLVWFGGDAPVERTAELSVELTWTPARSGTARLGFAAGGHGRVDVDGTELVSGVGAVRGPRLGASPLAPPSIAGSLAVVAGEPRAVVVRLRLARETMGNAGLLAIRVGLEPDDTPPGQLLDEAVAVAREADVAVVVVGTSSDVESEGFDRTTLALPGHQDDLVRAVADTGTPTVVVVNAGAPVLLPWRDDVAAVLVSSFGGQELGHALADVLLGLREPGGRLPTTWPGEDEPPVLDVTPVDGRLAYDEGIHVGHRAWLRAGRRPAYCFGHGLGYTTWSLASLRVDGGRVRVTATNTGDRAGKQVVQVYLAREDTAVDRPVRWLAGHAVVRAEPGEAVEVVVPLDARSIAHWEDGWQVEDGEYAVLVGTSVDDLPLTSTVAAAVLVGARERA